MTDNFIKHYVKIQNLNTECFLCQELIPYCYSSSCCSCWVDSDTDKSLSLCRGSGWYLAVLFFRLISRS